MINLTVINLKDLIKILIKIIIVTLVVAMIFEFIKIFKNMQIVKQIKEKLNNAQIEIIQSSTSIFSTEKIEISASGDKILDSEFASFYEEEDINDNVAVLENNVKIEKVEEQTQLQGLITKVVETNNKIDTFTTNYGTVKIRNESSYTLTEEMLNPNISFVNKKDILIFHTHTCESYTQTPRNTYVASGNYRTTDLNYSIARVGNELKSCLINKGFNMIHDTTYHDYPAYNGSYSRSLSTVKKILSNNKSTQLVIDLHRDALGNGTNYGPTVMIGEEQVAQLMFVIGTNGGGLTHNNWNTNLKLAILIQQKANEMYPGLFKPIILRDSRYNQHLADGACIIEVGATANTLEQATGSMKYLAEVISEVMK